MTRDEVLAYCLAKPGAWRDEPWEGDVVAKVGPKIFAFTGGDGVGLKLGRSREEADEWLHRYPDDASVMAYVVVTDGTPCDSRARFRATNYWKPSTRPMRPSWLPCLDRSARHHEHCARRVPPNSVKSATQPDRKVLRGRHPLGVVGHHRRGHRCPHS